MSYRSWQRVSGGPVTVDAVPGELAVFAIVEPHHSAVGGPAVEHREVSGQDGEAGVNGPVSDTDVLTGGDVLRIHGEFVPQVIAHRHINHVHAADVDTVRVQLPDEREVGLLAGPGRRERVTCVERLPPPLVLGTGDGVVLQDLQPERGDPAGPVQISGGGHAPSATFPAPRRYSSRGITITSSSSGMVRSRAARSSG